MKAALTVLSTTCKVEILYVCVFIVIFISEKWRQSWFVILRENSALSSYPLYFKLSLLILLPFGDNVLVWEESIRLHFLMIVELEICHQVVLASYRKTHVVVFWILPSVMVSAAWVLFSRKKKIVIKRRWYSILNKAVVFALSNIVFFAPNIDSTSISPWMSILRWPCLWLLIILLTWLHVIEHKCTGLRQKIQFFLLFLHLYI
jgi:hypothetical protein